MKHQGAQAYDSWFRCPQPRANASHRLYCFPYAGGGSSIFNQWPKQFLEHVEIRILQLPGRESRFQERPYTCMVRLVYDLCTAFINHQDIPYSLFGHSMGALICFELARELRRQGGTLPRHFFMAGERAPHLPPPEAINSLDDGGFIHKLKKHNGIPPEVAEHEDLMSLMLPLLRADFQLCESYRYQEDAPLSCSITALGGLKDPMICRAQLADWHIHTKSSFKLNLFAGSHFFLHECLKEITNTISLAIEAENNTSKKYRRT